MNLDSYSNSEFQEALRDVIASLLESLSLCPADEPQAILLGGQSGAGKTTLHIVYKELLANNVIVVNGDEYRKLHPHFQEIQDRYGIDAPQHTGAWAGAMVEGLIDALSIQGYNLIVEGTLRTSAAPMKTARLLRGRGYTVSLAVMAIKPEISLVSCRIRYEQMCIAGTTPRAVDPAHHQRIVSDIVDNLKTLESADVFEQVALFNRAGACLFQAKCPTKDPAASMALNDILFGDWTEEEKRHYQNLLFQLNQLQTEAEPGVGYLTRPVFLVGFMGAGKSSVAKLLGEMLGVGVADVDVLIEQKAGCPIPRIFEERGEEGFRRLESEVLQQVAGEPACIVDCGGGAVEREQNRMLMKKCGTVVYLQVDADEAAARIPDASSRPLFGDKKAASALLARRTPLYEQVADIQVDTRGRTPEQVAIQIAQELSRVSGHMSGARGSTHVSRDGGSTHG